MDPSNSRAVEVLTSRFEEDDVLLWHGANSLNNKSRYFVISEKWIVLFNSINKLEKPELWIPRNMVAQVAFSNYADSASGILEIVSTGQEVLNFGYFSDFQSMAVLGLLDKNEAAKLQAKIEAKGNQVGLLHGKTFGAEIKVYENKIYLSSKEMDLDENTVAEVMLEGQKVVTARPTLTRMAALSFLPGTALIPGLAFQKKSVKDERQLIIVIANAKTNISLELPVHQLAQAKAVANQINAIAENKHRNLANNATESNLPQVKGPENSLVQELRELKQMLDEEIINQSEFEILKTKLIGERNDHS